MTSFRVTGSTLLISIYDVVGRDGAQVNFISHTGLAESGGLQNPLNIPVLDMAPPLHGPTNRTIMPANVLGNAKLTFDDEQKIKTFIERNANEHASFAIMTQSQVFRNAPQMYCILPHSNPFREEDGRFARMRYSCAGFVLEAYKSAQIELVDLEYLPLVDLATIKLAYPNEVALIERERISKESLGLEGNGPWPVLLCGYLIHALNRDAQEIRNKAYSPNSRDHSFK